MAVAPTTSAVRWMSYFADNGALDVDESHGNLIWAVQQQGAAVECSADGAGAKVDETEDDLPEASGSRKRQREECTQGTATSKANREKLRRDRLNDRFVDLSRALDCGKPPKNDKATILCDAVRVISQLRQEAVQLKEGNAQLKDQIKELKAEKNELRDEKARLKAEKDRLEQQLKSMSSMPAMPSMPSMPSYQPGFVQHPAAMHAAAAAAAFAAQAQAQAQAPIASKLTAPSPVAPVAMWQWLPPASVDTSQDHMLRPPVA